MRRGIVPIVVPRAPTRGPQDDTLPVGGAMTSLATLAYAAELARINALHTIRTASKA